MRFWILLPVFALCCLVLSCKNRTPGSSQTSTPELDSLLTALEREEAPAGEAAPSPTLAPPGNSGPPAKVIVPDESKYAAVFLTKLSHSGLASEFELADSLLIVEKLDTFVFPMELPFGEWTNFMAVKSGYTYSLDVAKINFTTLEFNFELRKAGQTLDQITGQASLSPGFILGSESDEDNQTGNSYFCNEYFFENETCQMSIRLGDDEGIRKVKIIKNCKSGKYDIALEDCPVLLEK